jgi:hypothetical protein
MSYNFFLDSDENGMLYWVQLIRQNSISTAQNEETKRHSEITATSKILLYLLV